MASIVSTIDVPRGRPFLIADTICAPRLCFRIEGKLCFLSNLIATLPCLSLFALCSKCQLSPQVDDANQIKRCGCCGNPNKVPRTSAQNQGRLTCFWGVILVVGWSYNFSVTKGAANRTYFEIVVLGFKDVHKTTGACLKQAPV
jgi:hypothetical protein